jgi:CO/xanthine dehydrogenase FAD-binding subunit
MDLNTIADVVRPRHRRDVAAWQAADAWLAGGTWLFSEPQPSLTRLIDLSTLDWPPLTPAEDGLEIAATCTIAQLDAFSPPAPWIAARLIDPCCRAFVASFKIWNAATVGGNLCLSLPAGPMISLTAALDGVCTIWTPDGGERRISVLEFITGPQRNVLLAGEVLRSITLPAEALTRKTAFRRISLTPLGRSAALIVGTLCPRSGAFALTVTAATRRPFRLSFPRIPDEEELRTRIARDISPPLYFDDIHGSPAWRRHMTLQLGEEARAELAGGSA